MPYLVKDFMNKDIITINAETTILEASKKIADNPPGCAIVLSKGQPIGMMTEIDIVRKVIAKGLTPSEIKVSEVMSSPLVIIDPDEELSKTAETMKTNNIRKLPVVRNGIVYEIITARDITDHLTDYIDKIVREILVYTSPFRF